LPALQRELVPLWSSIEKLSGDEQTIVVVPSLTVDYDIRGSVLQAYEERFLFLLLLLRQPRARLIYVSSQVIHLSIVDYYLCLLPGVIDSHARSRLHLVTPMDGSPRPLTLELLQRPRLLRHPFADPQPGPRPVASDHVESRDYRAFNPDDLFDIAVRHGLHFDRTRETGGVFHMMTAWGAHGHLGLTAVANSHDDAERYYQRTLDVLNEEAAAALRTKQEL